MELRTGLKTLREDLESWLWHSAMLLPDSCFLSSSPALRSVDCIKLCLRRGLWSGVIRRGNLLVTCPVLMGVTVRPAPTGTVRVG